MFLCKTLLFLMLSIYLYGYVTEGTKTGSTSKRRTSSAPKSAIKYHGSENTGGSYATGRLLTQESRPHGKRQTYSYAATQKPVSYSHSYDSGPQYYESNNPPQSYYREYRSPPSSYNVDYNEKPSGNSYHSPPQRSQRRNSYNNQDSGEHKDGDEQSYGTEDDYSDGGYGDNDSNHDEGEHGHSDNDSHGDNDDYVQSSESRDSPTVYRGRDDDRRFSNLDY